jgi:phage-related protein
MKPLKWMGTSYDDLSSFPRQAKKLAGTELMRVQFGGDPTDWKPMSGIGPGVKEIRVHLATECRVIYVAKFAEYVYVLHAFEKTSQKTSKRDLNMARRRYKLVFDRIKDLS